MSRRNRLSIGALEEWIDGLLRLGRTPPLSNSAREYMERDLRDQLMQLNLSTTGWRLLVAQMAGIAYEFADGYIEIRGELRTIEQETHGSRLRNNSTSSEESEQPGSSALENPILRIRRRGSIDSDHCAFCGRPGHMSQECMTRARINMERRNDQIVDGRWSTPSVGMVNNRSLNRRGRGGARGFIRRGGRLHHFDPRPLNVSLSSEDFSPDDQEGLANYREMRGALRDIENQSMGLANYLQSQFDPATEPIIHVVSHRIMKCTDPDLQGGKNVPTFSLAAARYKPTENPPWTLSHAREDTIDKIKNIREWAKNVAEKHNKTRRTAAEKVVLNAVKSNKWSCVDDTRLVCPLIIEGVCIEDVLPDTGSQFNAISVKGLWALMGRFPSWAKAFETAISWCDKEKVIQAAGGQEIPILAVIRLHVQVAGKKAIPLHWAIYEDTEPIIVLGTKGMRALELQLKSPNLGNVNILVPKDEVVSTSNKVYSAAFHPPKIERTPKTPSDVVMQSDHSLDSPMDIPEAVGTEENEAAKQFLRLAKITDQGHMSLYDRDMARLQLNATDPHLAVLENIKFDKNLGRMGFREARVERNPFDQPGTSYQMREQEAEEEQDFRDGWDQWRSPSYDE